MQLSHCEQIYARVAINLILLRLYIQNKNNSLRVQYLSLRKFSLCFYEYTSCKYMCICKATQVYRKFAALVCESKMRVLKKHTHRPFSRSRRESAPPSAVLAEAANEAI